MVFPSTLVQKPKSPPRFGGDTMQPYRQLDVIIFSNPRLTYSDPHLFRTREQWGETKENTNNKF